MFINSIVYSYINLGKDIPVDQQFVVKVIEDYITALSANISWTVPEDYKNIQFRLHIYGKGFCMMYSRYSYIIHVKYTVIFMNEYYCIL